jgi:predicted transcriptional regulator
MTVSVTLDPAEQERLAALARSRRQAPHELMREAIRQYLDREEGRASFRKEAYAAWREYQKTGLHLTGAEAVQWLDSWGTEAETPPPRCHR